MPPTPFTPEIEHAEVTLDNVAVADIDVLPGDGYEQYVKPFRTVEDIHVHAALAGHLVRLARTHLWPREVIEDLLALVAALRSLAACAPSSRATHVALAGVLRQGARVLADCETHLAAPLGGMDEDTRARWQRDRPLLQVAARARAERRESAWRNHAAPQQTTISPAATTSESAAARTHRSRFCALVIDCKVDDIDAATDFWSRALGREASPVTPESGNYRDIAAAAEEPMILLQKVDHPSRVHLDIETDDVDAEVLRLEALGARKVAFVKRWWVMEAPTGHRFCVVRPQRGPLEGHANARQWTSK